MKQMFLNKNDKFKWQGDERIIKGEEGWYSSYILDRDGLKVRVNVYFDEEPEHFKGNVEIEGEKARVIKVFAGATIYDFQGHDFTFSKRIENQIEEIEVDLDFFKGKKCEFVFSGMIRVDKAK